MSLWKNARKNNHPPTEEISIFQSSTLLSQKEVGDIIQATGKWGEEEIKLRHEKIVSFALEYWRIGK